VGLARFRFLALCVAMAQAISFACAAVPNYAVEEWCDKVARSVGPRSEVIYGGCIRDEQSAYDRLKTEWDMAPSAAQSWCDQVGRSVGPGSYQILLRCLEDEAEAARQNKTQPFKR
jgi:hypothetical protein